MPQGSWLGPLCFIVYVSDMNFPRDIWIHKYIDDTTLSEQFKNPHESNIQSAANAIASWSDTNKMKMNVSKTKEMLINFQKENPNVPHFTINDANIEKVSKSKLLGVSHR